MKSPRYAAAGVDISAKTAALERAKSAIRSTFTPQVLGDIGGFGGLFRPDFSGYREPVLVASADGVGTKLKIAVAAGRHDICGTDLVNHCVNDILVQGAKPLFFLDYIAAGKLDGAVLLNVIEGIARACRENGTALLGGETAEMPGMYAPGDYDLAGTIVGVVERAKILNASRVCVGDLAVGLLSSGLHTNGYSLARKVLFDVTGLRVDDRPDELEGASVGEVLLATHRSYLKPLTPLLEAGLVHTMAHITGGGFYDNIPRVLPEAVDVRIRDGAWPVPPVFGLIGRLGEVSREEMFHVFNMGIGMVLFIDPSHQAEVAGRLASVGERPYFVGNVVAGYRGVTVEPAPT